MDRTAPKRRGLRLAGLPGDGVPRVDRAGDASGGEPHGRVTWVTIHV